MWVIILNSVVAISLIICLATLIIVKNRNLYCAIFMYKDRKLWKYLIENASKFKQTYEAEKSIWFEWNEYELLLWKNDGLISVHKNDDCILSYYDEKMSKKMYNTLKVLGKFGRYTNDDCDVCDIQNCNVDLINECKELI